ncbi:hypothetical protein CONPUDRAFT_136074 [Coniophora puteana RWD-64-598 SS2]|uniref:Uncharacterized protein n=1 Tax=Coniophora puteana (strain RWD-64-598) TaxID=741705 RepID=A0A5M3MW73_CONPW|nr:uncharacterized protein CONPUDRAFT_136074 [Coniophora puteana RWD-64-598 SS2]EIW82841.1 hypothetical protein CONPUDRAFT_136074 [Coniophora puteana RWD-64-598 SS2]
MPFSWLVSTLCQPSQSRGVQYTRFTLVMVIQVFVEACGEGLPCPDASMKGREFGFTKRQSIRRQLRSQNSVFRALLHGRALVRIASFRNAHLSLGKIRRQRRRYGMGNGDPPGFAESG